MPTDQEGNGALIVEKFAPIDMKVLFVTPYFEPNVLGGAEISTRIIAEALQNQGVDVSVLSVIAEGFERSNSRKVFYQEDKEIANYWRKPLVGQDYSLSEKAALFHSSAVKKKSLYKEYNEFFQKQGFDFIVANSNCECFGRKSLWRAASESSRLIIALRDPILLERSVQGVSLEPIMRKIFTHDLKYVSGLVSPSQYMLNLHLTKDERGIKKRVIPNPIEPVKTKSQTKNRARIVYAGSLEAHKGIETLLCAARFLPDAEIVLIGRGSFANDIRVAQSDNIRVVEWMNRTDLIDFIGESQVLVLPSEYPEAFGRVLVEAIEASTIAIGSNAGGIPEVLNYDERYIFPQGEVDTLVKKLNRVLHLERAEYCKEISDLHKMSEKYLPSSCAKEWISFFQSFSHF